MTLNEDTIRELLDAAEPAPWSVAMLDLHRETGVVDNEHAVANQKLAALAPELAADWPSPYSQPHNTQRNIMQANLPTNYAHARRQGDAGLDLRAAGEHTEGQA